MPVYMALSRVVESGSAIEALFFYNQTFANFKIGMDSTLCPKLADGLPPVLMTALSKVHCKFSVCNSSVYFNHSALQIFWLQKLQLLVVSFVQ